MYNRVHAIFQPPKRLEAPQSALVPHWGSLLVFVVERDVVLPKVNAAGFETDVVEALSRFELSPILPTTSPAL